MDRRQSTVCIWDLGCQPYQTIWAQQQAWQAKLIACQQAVQPCSQQLFFCEHPHVYTLGRMTQDGHLLAGPAMLEAWGAEVVSTNRGGDITYHGPGQLVVYPVFDLLRWHADVHRYLRTLEAVVVATLADFGIVAGTRPGLTGVWTGITEAQPQKICALGIQVRRWVTIHGLALNVNTDLAYFGHIVPCGLVDSRVTSMAEKLGQPVAMSQVKAILQQHMLSHFDLTTVSVGSGTGPEEKTLS